MDSNQGVQQGGGLIKKLLIVACVLGMLQGLLTLVGGIITSFDRDATVFLFKTFLVG